MLLYIIYMTEEDFLLTSIFAEDFNLDSFNILNKGFKFKSKILNKETCNRKVCNLDLEKKSFFNPEPTITHSGTIRDDNLSSIKELIKYKPVIDAFANLKSYLLKTRSQNYESVESQLENYNLNFKNDIWNDYIRNPDLFNLTNLYTFLKDGSFDLNYNHNLYLTDIDNNKFFIKKTGEISNYNLKNFYIECQADLRQLYYYIFQYLHNAVDLVFLQNILANYNIKLNILSKDC